MDLEFRDLTYTVRNRLRKGPGKQVLKNISGKFSSGQLVAILGPSGAGKSSLLNVISGYKSGGITGELLINGEPRDEQQFKKLSCYITQEDLLQPLLSVREAMDVAASLKLPKGSKAPTEDILQQIGLLEHQHTRTDQLSGGQKKRLSIALELVNNPPVFFLDEPTSGLDTVTTVQCVKLLKQLARQGRTVVCTIHQPTASLFEQFDQAYVVANGYCIYQGDTEAVVPHLASNGLVCPRNNNPADFMIETTENPEHIKLLSEAIQNGKTCKSSKVGTDTPTNEPINLKIFYQNEDAGETEMVLQNTCTYTVPQCRSSRNSTTSLTLSNNASSLEWMKMQKTNDNIYPTTSFQQFFILLCRMMLQISRNRTALWIQFVHHLMCGILIGLCFYNTANDGTQMFNQLKLCVGLVIFFAYTQIMVPVLIYPQEVKLVKKERFNGWYKLFPYYAAMTVSKLPLQLTLNTLFCTLTFIMTGVPFTVTRFIVFCLVGNVVSLVSEGFGLAIGSIFNITNGCAMAPAVIAPFLGLAIYGFDFAERIPLMMNILMKTSFLRCGVVATVLTIFGFGRQPLDCQDVYCHFAKPNVLLRFLDLENTSVSFEIFLMVVIMFITRFICYMGLKWRFST